MRPEPPVTGVLTILVAGLLTAALVDWQPGVVVVGLSLLMAAGLRLSLPARQAGVLVVRGKAFDAAVLLGLGFALVALATAVPEG